MILMNDVDLIDHPAVDVAIVGGGPAGLSAALVLARSRKRIIVFDENRPRNAVARSVYGYLGFDGVTPQGFRDAGRREVARYGGKQGSGIRGVFLAGDADGGVQFAVVAAAEGAIAATAIHRELVEEDASWKEFGCRSVHR
jgi:thioredoxin reductase